jgi:hypothetical protein
MTPDESALAKHGMDVVFSPVRDFFAKLAGIPGEEAGNTIADTLRIYRWKRSLKLLEDVKREAEARRIEPRRVPLKTLLPILEGASLEEDESMHRRWKWLLLNASKPSVANEVPPALPEILRQLSPAEAGILDQMFDALVAEVADRPLALIEWPKVEPHMLHGIMQTTQTKRESAALDNLVRLELIRRELRGAVRERGNDFSFPQSTSVIFASFDYSLTALGYEFITACRKPAPNQVNGDES